MAKKVKISKVKRSQHLKHKQNYGRQQKKNVKASNVGEKKLTVGKKIFGNERNASDSNNSRKRKGNEQREKKVSAHVPLVKVNEHNASDENEFDAEDVMDMLNENESSEGGNSLSGASDVDGNDDDDGNEREASAGPRKKRKRKENELVEVDDTVALEQEYAQDAREKSRGKRTVDLLPIKTKRGEVISRTTEVEIKHDVEEDEAEDENEEEDEEIIDSDDEILNDNAQNLSALTSASGKAISTTDLLILREQEVNRQKYRIGIICSGILEKPEEKMKNFNLLFDLIGDRNKNGDPNLFSVRKIGILSMLEVFKDVIPEYRIGQINLKTQQVKKTTMERVSFEDTLQVHYKKFLQRLEKMTNATSKCQQKMKREQIMLAEISSMCLCELLTAHPYFNFSQNVAQLLVYLLNCNNQAIRTRIHTTFKQLFVEDKKFELTLFIVRRLNNLIKSKSNAVHVELVTCLMALQIKSINLNEEKESELKQKKMEAHKARLINMSKKERKRMKKLKELDKELLEAKAEENKQTKHQKLTEISKMVFTIYFRILKNDPNSRLLSATLEGLAEFAHVINLDFFADLIEVLNGIMENSELGYREQLHCVQTVFTILSGQGEVLNIDPLRFYGHLYRNMLVCHAGKNHGDFVIILKTLCDVLIKRRKSITPNRMMAFLKRIALCSLQLQHHGTIACLGIIKTVMQLSSTVEKILDTDMSTGSGQYDPYLDDPEYCNATCTSIYELTALARHYHPIVRKMAFNIACGVPASGDGSLPPEIGKLSPMELYHSYDSSEMAFNPPVQPLKPVDESKTLKFKRRHIYANEKLERFCKKLLRTPLDSEFSPFDFYSDFKRNVD